MKQQADSTQIDAVVIGGSAGAVSALLQILPSLPGDYPLPIMIVVHLPPQGDSLLAGLLNERCQIQVKEAEDKEPIRAGIAYVAPPNYHLLVEPDFLLSLSLDEPILYSRPSIDVLFESAADAYGSNLMAILLTGASMDGSDGIRRVGQAGGLTYVQDPESAESPLMPSAALEAWPSAQALSLTNIASVLQKEIVSASR